MKKYHVVLSKSAEKSLTRLPVEIISKIIPVVKTL